MPQKVQLHPTAEEFAAFGLGKLAPEQAAPISRHVAECEPCSETLAGFEADTFLELVRRADDAESMSGAEDAGSKPSSAASGRQSTSSDGLPAELANHP